MAITYKYQKDPRFDKTDVVVKTITDDSGKYVGTTSFIISDSNSTNTDYLEWKEWDAESGNTTTAAD